MEHWAKIGQGALEITLEVLLNGVIKLWEKLYRDEEELVSSDWWLKHQVKLTKFLFSSNIYIKSVFKCKYVLLDRWFHKKVTRIEAESLLNEYQKGDGSFLVRPSAMFVGEFSLSFW